MAEEVVQNKKPGGGTATGGGINFQAAVTAIAGAHLLRGIPLGWLPVGDVPVAIWAESEGAGDDMRLELASSVSAEVQVKKGLVRGAALWEALEALITAVRDGRLDCGILAVAPDSSRTVREDLAKDLERIGQGRHDHLTDIGAELYSLLRRIGGASEPACRQVGIRVVHALKADDADIRAAKESLRWVCADEAQAEAAWNALYRDAVALVEHRGRWTVVHLFRLFEKEGIGIRDADFPAAIATKLTDWVRSTRDSFALPGSRKRLPLSALLEMRTTEMAIEQPDAENAAKALARYHGAAGGLVRDTPIYDAEWTGRFRRRAVIVGGPGLGKSTLMTLLASSYATDGFPVLSAKLKPIAAAMERGDSFDHALRSLALDGSGITPERFDCSRLKGLVVLVDGLDDCGSRHDAVARALHSFSVGHPDAHVVVSTRPIGYTTAALADWKHYRLLAPDKDRGARHLARLLGALKNSDDVTGEAVEFAKRELVASRAAEAISTSPHLLGMAATLMSSRGKLPNTRHNLYTQLIGLFETSDGAASARPVPAIIAANVLNALGWQLMLDPLAPADALAERCAELLAAPMGRAPLATIELVESTLRYWEQRGLIEQVHHDGTVYWTFVHKTFTEFTAARYLKTLTAAERADQLDRLVDQPDWHEAVAFAAGLGLGDQIAHLLVNRRAMGHPGQMERALALAADRDAEVSDEQIAQLAKLAFEAVEGGGSDRFRVGLALAEAANAHPMIVGSIAAVHLQHEHSWVQLVAWACVLAAEPHGHGAVELAQVLNTLLPTISKGLSASLLGGMRLSGDKDRDLIERIALAALAAQPDADVKAFVELHLEHEALRTWRFENKVAAVLRARGFAEKVELPSARSWASSAFALLNPPDEWRRASLKAIRALAEASIAGCGETDRENFEPSRFPQFGALVALTGFNEVPAYEVYRWEEPYDATALRAVVQALVHASAIDARALSAEAVAILHSTDANDRLSWFDFDLPVVDVPEPDWRRAGALILDRGLLVTAMNNGSQWMACVAGNILAASSATEEQSRALLANAVGTPLWAATEVVRQQQRTDVANALILDRLAGSLPEGAEHLFKGLEKGRVELSPALREAIQRGLAGPSPTIAIAAANLAKALAERGQPLEQKVIVDAYDDWLVDEPERKGGIIPPSPRETLLQLLIGQEALDDDRLLATLSDVRSDVRNVGERRILDAIATSKSLKDSLIDRILSRTLPPSIAANVLRRETPLSGVQIRALEELLHERDAKWRRAGVELLRRYYLTADQIVAHAARLSSDCEDEIRVAVEQRVAAANASSP